MKIRISLIGLLIASMLAGCDGETKPPEAQAAVAAAQAKRLHYHPTVRKMPLAVLNFDNNAIDQRAALAPLVTAFPAMLTSDLVASGVFDVVERGKIKTILQQMALSQSGVLAQGVAIRVGRMVGAKNILFGSFISIGKQLRIDVRVVDVESSKLLIAESVSGAANHLLRMEKTLLKKLVTQARQWNANHQ